MADQLPFQEAIDFFAGKVNLPTKRYDDLRHAAHVRSWSVSGVTRDEMLTDFKKAMLRAITEGTGFNEFQKSFDEIVDRTGWKFNARGETERERRAWRANIIYKTNMRTSYMAGRYKQLTDPDLMQAMPYWQYVHSGALNPRELHMTWDGLVLLATDPAWRYMFPPNGWGCGCDIEALSDDELRAMGKNGPDQAPDLTPYERTDPRTGLTEMHISGIDRGWEYNVGEEWLHGIVPTELHQPLAPLDTSSGPDPDLPPLPKPKPASKDDLLPPGLEPQSYVNAFMKAFGMDDDGGYYRDVSGGIITIGRSMFEARTPDGQVLGLKADKRGRGAYTLLLAEAIKDPDEIWVDWAKVKSGIALKRAYLKRVLLPDGHSLLVRFEWTPKGWFAITGFQTKEHYLDEMRKGALLYRRKQ